MKSPALILYVVAIACGLAFAVYNFLHKEWFPGVLLAVIGLTAGVTMISALSSVRHAEIPLDASGSSGQIVMQLADVEIDSTLMWAVGFLGCAVGLVMVPDALWTRWLSYPGAFVALGLSCFVLWIGTREKIERIVADSSGVEVRTEERGQPREVEKIAWSRVATVKRVTRTIRKMSRYNRGPSETTHEFVLLDRDGEPLLNLKEPLKPPDRYQRFLESIPRWTGLPVQEENR